MTETELVEAEASGAVIGAFFRVYNRLGFGFEVHRVVARQVYNYLRATNLEVGLLLHFGPEPKFYRLYSPNPRESDQSGSSD